jgi:hypothetical protein
MTGPHAPPTVGYSLIPSSISEVAPLFAKYHGYGSVGRLAVYCFAVVEASRAVAAFVWQPPPPGAALSVCPERPQSVLSLSRMVAVPRSERELNHVSRPLKRQMRHLIDRGRWPVLVTYSDEGQGHSGHVYKCSGWRKTARNHRAFWVDETGARRSSYSNGQGADGLILGGMTWLQRWEHWACPVGSVDEHMGRYGWAREPIPGKFWKSGAQAHRMVNRAPTCQQSLFR